MSTTNVIPVRPLNVGALLDAAEASGLSDDEIGEMIHRWFPDSLLPSWGPSWSPSPQSDGWRIHALPCGALAGPDHGGLTAGEMPTDAELDASNARAAERRSRMRLVVDGMDGGGM